MYKKINLIQHIGAGVPDSESSWKWYRKFFGLDIPMFDSIAEAPLMLPYTNNKVVNKRATMVLNLQGGCAMEIVELKSSNCQPPKNIVHQLGDLGIFISKVRSLDVKVSFDFFKKNGVGILSEIIQTPDKKTCFFLKDPNGLLFQVVQEESFFSKNGHPSGGLAGCIIGVSDIGKAKKLYCDLLGFDKIIYDQSGIFEDFASLPGGNQSLRRVLLTQSKGPMGVFSKLAGPAGIELVQSLDRKPVKMMEGRIWGDLGFIHLGLDVKGMAAIEKEFSSKGFPFTCNSNNALKMGSNTEVHCTYIEDPDGTLIELIEVYKIPLLKKLGIFLNVEKRNPEIPLPSWLLRGLRFGRIKD